MKLTTIQLHEDTKKKIETRKSHPRESYDSVIRRVLENEEIPSIEDMFKHGDTIKQTKKYTTKEIIKTSHELREKK